MLQTFRMVSEILLIKLWLLIKTTRYMHFKIMKKNKNKKENPFFLRL